MSIESTIATYGYVAVLAGVLVEGELVVITAGFLAYRQVLDLDGVIGAAVLGSVLTYQFFFILGRSQGTRFLHRRPNLRERVARVQGLLERYHTGVTLGYRALFGLRMVTPFALGMTRVSQRRFLLLDIAPAIVWGVTFACIGYFMGHQLDAVLARVREYEAWAALAVAGAAGLALLVVYFTHRLARR